MTLYAPHGLNPLHIFPKNLFYALKGKLRSPDKRLPPNLNGSEGSRFAGSVMPFFLCGSLESAVAELAVEVERGCQHVGVEPEEADSTSDDGEEDPADET